MAKYCLNPHSEDVMKLAKATGLDPVVAAAKIGVYMDSKLTNK